MALTPNSLARRKSGVQIPSPPPPTLQVRAPSASSGRRSPLAAAAPRPRAQVPVQPGRLAATRRLGPGPSTATTERGRRLHLSYASAATPDSPEQKPPWLRPMACRSRIRRDGLDPGPPGRVAARRTDTLHEVTGTDTADADAGRADTRPRGHREVHTRTLDSGCVDTCADTGRSPGHRTPDAWTRPSTWTGPPRHGSTGQTSWTTTTTRPPAGPPNRGPVDGVCAARQRRGFGDGEVPAGARLPTALPGACSVTPSAKPRPGALLSSDDYGSSVEQTAKLHPLCRVADRGQAWVLSGTRARCRCVWRR
jgi:hypothetical protein